MTDIWLDKFCKTALPVIRAECNPVKVILFGSRVTGMATDSSDLDVIVVSDFFKAISFVKRAAILLKKIRFEKHIDMICYDPEEFERVKLSSAILQDALSYGVTVS
jgi:predicted nucleotidyltransferase